MKRLIAALALVVCANCLIEGQTWRYQRRHRQQAPVPAPTPVPAPVPATLSVADQIVADMQGQNEGHPHGVPLSWDFANGPMVDMANDPQGNRAAVQWGAVYADATGSFSTNTRINIRSCEIYWKQKSTGTWITGTKTSQPQIDLYAENFSASYGSANTRIEQDGTISVLPTANRVAHFYPRDRFPIIPTDVAGWVAICQMRLILNNQSGVDDRSLAHYLGSVGADYYPSTSGPGIENNPPIAGGKFKYIKSDWRSFAMTTLGQSQLESNPPPIDLSGVLP